MSLWRLHCVCTHNKYPKFAYLELMTKYNYNIINSPYFNIPDVNYVISYNKKNKKIYKPIDNMCWNVPTPCSNRSSVKMIYIKKYKAIVKKER